MDTATFLPQVFWLVVVFFTFYLIVLKNILPGLSQILKVRSKKLSQGKDIFAEMKEEENNAKESLNQAFANSSKTSGQKVQETATEAFSWVSNSLSGTAGKKTSLSQVQEMNRKYLNQISEIKGKGFLLQNMRI